MGPSGITDLVRRAQAGDRVAMDRIFEILRPYIEPLARRYTLSTRPGQSTADLLQESVLRAWRSIDTFRVAETDGRTLALLLGWTRKIVRNLGVDMQRAVSRSRRRPQAGLVSLHSLRTDTSSAGGSAIGLPSRERSPSTHARGNELEETVRVALEQTDSRGAEIVRMHVFENLSLAEISRKLSLSPSTVREHYWTSVEKLKKDLSDWL